jgi:integrase
VPTRKQLDALAAGLPADWALSVWLMRGCGLRVGEALAVSEKSILPGVLRVSEQVLDTFPPRIGPLKHRKPGQYRDLPLPDYVADRVKAHIKEHGVTDDGYVFRGRKTALPRQNGYRISFATSKEKAGLPPEFTAHDLRHTAASIWLRGIPITDVAKWLGHRSIQVTYTT